MNFLQLLCGCINSNRRRKTMAHCSDNIEANIPCFVRLPDCRVYQVHVSKNARGQDCLYKVSSGLSAWRVQHADPLRAGVAREFSFLNPGSLVS